MIEVQVEENKRNKYAHVIRGKRKNKTSGFLFRAFPSHSLMGARPHSGYVNADALYPKLAFIEALG